MKSIYVFSEDRPQNEIGLRIALASLFRHAPDARAVAYWPCATEDFRRWSAQFSGLELISSLPEQASSWNCKPQAIIPLLRRGEEVVIWLDSDMLLTRDPSPLFNTLEPEILCATEEPPGQPHLGSASLSSSWGMELGHEYPISLNSSVLRTSQRHLQLLERWKECLADARYVEAQQRPLDERPRHLMSDQDVLFALMGSKEFMDIPLRYLKGGNEIIHCGGALGYSMKMRLGGLFHQIPTFLHAISGKPWWVFRPEYRSGHRFWFTFYRRLLQETSPYVREARKYRDEIGMDCDWMDYHTVIGRILIALGFHNYALCGMPLSLVATAAVEFRRAIRRASANTRS